MHPLGNRQRHQQRHRYKGDIGQQRQQSHQRFNGRQHQRFVLDVTKRRFVDEFLADKPQKARYAGHRQRGQPGRNRQQRHHPAQTTQLPYIARARFVVNRPGHHKQRALVQRMYQQEQRGRFGGDFRVPAKQRHQHAQRTDG